METYLIIECNSSPLSFPFFSIHINYKHLNLHKIVLVKQKKGKKSIYLFAKREVSLSLSLSIYIYIQNVKSYHKFYYKIDVTINGCYCCHLNNIVNKWWIIFHDCSHII